jgi:uncharacterized protein YdeI (YjbR/CyaY-like superfamily)
LKPRFFKTASEFRAWLETNHALRAELSVGFYKKASGQPSISWHESVDQALCFGWIDGVRKSLGDDSYTVRFTPRKPKSKWSAVNIRRVKELDKVGHMHPAGIQAFAGAEAQPPSYSYEQRKTARLNPGQEKQFRANKRAWTFFQSQPPWYRRTATWWVISARKEDTRQSRLRRLIADSAEERSIAAVPKRSVPKRPRK